MSICTKPSEERAPLYLELASQFKGSRLRRYCGLFGLVNDLLQQAKPQHIAMIEQLLAGSRKIPITVHSMSAASYFEETLRQARESSDTKATELREKERLLLDAIQHTPEALENALLAFEQSWHDFAYQIASEKLKQMDTIVHI